MSKRIGAAMSRESGRVSGGTIEASCTLAFDESSPQEPETVQRYVDLAIMACRQALDVDPGQNGSGVDAP
jgi:hypothetical protein